MLGWFLRRTAGVDVASEGVGIDTVVQRAEQEAVFTRLLWQVLPEILTIRYLRNRFCQLLYLLSTVGTVNDTTGSVPTYTAGTVNDHIETVGTYRTHSITLPSHN